MKQWIIRLLSDSTGEPSTRLHLAWFMMAAVFYAIYKGSDATIVGILAGSMTTLAGLSVVHKSNKSNKSTKINNSDINSDNNLDNNQEQG